MACCLTALSHYLNHGWIIIKGAVFRRVFREMGTDDPLQYGDTDNFSGVSSITLPLLISNFVGTWAPTNKIIGDIPDFTVLNVPIFQPRHNIEGVPWHSPGNSYTSSEHPQHVFSDYTFEMYFIFTRGQWVTIGNTNKLFVNSWDPFINIV